MQGSKWAILILILLSSCKKADLTPDEYVKWLRSEKDMSKTEEIGPFKYKADVVPAEWIAYTNLYPKGNVKDYGKKLEEASGMYYIRLTIDMKEGKLNALRYNLHAESEYFQRLYYVSYLMKNDIKLVVEGKEYPCRLYSYERAYDLNSRLCFLLGFEKPELSGDVSLEAVPSGINDDRVKMKFNGNVFQSFPKLSLE